MNASLERLTGSLDALDKQFKNYAHAQALAYGAQGDWTPIRPDESTSSDEVDQLEAAAVTPITIDEAQAFLQSHPNSPIALRMLAQAAITTGDFETARDHLLKLKEIEPNDADNDGLYAMLAVAYSELNDEANKVASLRTLEKLSPNPLSAIRSLIEVESQSNNWNEVIRLSEKYLASSPMRTLPYEWKLDAALKQDKLELASDSLNALLQLDPIDPARLHYLSALSWKDRDGAKSKRHVLQALEIAPRYLDALRLLQETSGSDSTNEVNSLNLPETN
jgi:tetratricopeptide (TPR) repeat protein